MMGRPGGALSLWLAAILAMTLTMARSETIQVTIRDLKFSPDRIEARVGDTVEWINKDILAHTATAEGGGTLSFRPTVRAARFSRRPGRLPIIAAFIPT